MTCILRNLIQIRYNHIALKQTCDKRIDLPTERKNKLVCMVLGHNYLCSFKIYRSFAKNNDVYLFR